MLEDYFKKKEDEWENLCIRCGGCCGGFDDPCKHLKNDRQGRFYCDIYPYRLGIRETTAGEKFNCVPVKKIINTYWKNDYLCKCKKEIRRRI